MLRGDTGSQGGQRHLPAARRNESKAPGTVAKSQKKVDMGGEMR